MSRQNSLLYIGMVFLGCVGCGHTRDDSSLIGNVAFTVLADGKIYLTTPEGRLVVTDGSNQTHLVLESSQGKFSWVDSSSDGKMLVVELSSLEADIPPQTLLLLLKKDGDVTELARTNGAVPCFRDGAKTVLLCRPDRFVERAGFGGGFWTEYKVFSWNWEDNSVTQLSEATFFRVDDVAYDNLRSEVLVSASFVRADESVFEKVVRVDEEGFTDLLEEDCKRSNVCSGDPGASITGHELLYISDTRQSFYYDLILLNRQTGIKTRLHGSESCRFFRFPEFDSEGRGVYALAASKFTFDGQPILDLIYYSDGIPKVILRAKNMEPKVPGSSVPSHVPE